AVDEQAGEERWSDRVYVIEDALPVTTGAAVEIDRRAVRADRRALDADVVQADASRVRVAVLLDDEVATRVVDPLGPQALRNLEPARLVLDARDRAGVGIRRWPHVGHVRVDGALGVITAR